jgi:hypothetical protein
LPNVVYTASGTFNGVVSGTDPFQLNNYPFTITIYANEAKFATKYGQQWAEYTGLKMQGSITSGILGGNAIALQNQTTGIILAVGNPNADIFVLGTGVLINKTLQVGISAKIAAPKGTITNDHVLPFTAPVTLDPSNATATYTFSGTSTTLGLSGTLTGVVMGTATVTKLQLHSAGARVITSHADGTQTMRSLSSAPVAPTATSDKVMLRFYASGVRSASDVHVQVAGQELPLVYAGAAADFAGLDQVIVEVPRSLAGLGKAEVMLSADGQTASPIHIQIQ